MRTSTKIGRRSRATAVLCLAMVLGACSGSAPPEAADTKDEQFWAPLRITGDEAEGFATLSEMVASAETVARGRLMNLRVSREFRGEAVEDVVTYAAADFKVDEVLAGDGIADTVPLEFLLSASADDAQAQVDAQRGQIPSTDIVVFLRAKRGEGESGLYRVVNSYGLWTPSSRAPLDTPLSEERAGGIERYGTELADVDSLAELISYVKQQ